MALMQRSGETPAQVKERTNTDVVSLEESSNVEKENLEFSTVVAYVKSQFERAKDKRRNDEDRFLMAYRNFRGVYGPEVQFTDTEKSQAFIKITKTKVLAAAAQIVDVLFAGGKFPITVQPTPSPIGTMEVVNVETGNQPPKPPEQTQKLRSTTSRLSIATAIAPVADKLEGIPEDKIEEGRSSSPTAVHYEPAQIAARLMDKQIQDQLTEANADKILRSVALEMSLLGGAFVKGPFTNEKEYPKWDETGTYIPETIVTPDISFVSTWNAYPDPDARNMAEAEKFIERHRLSRTDLKNLKKLPFFRKKSIDKAIDIGPDYRKEYWEEVIDEANTAYEVERYEVLEFWGMIDKETAEDDLDFDIPSSLKDMDQIQVNIWVCNGQVIRMLLNPFTPVRIPYHYVPYELNPYSFFGIGVAENMEDTQLLMNGFMRMAVDNASLSGNLLIEVDESRLAPGQSLDVYPGKVFRRDGGAPGQAIFGTSFPNISNELFMMFDKARQLADESTGIPSYAHGGTGVPGVGRTASGMSMLMGAAAQNIKAVVRNIDDYLLGPLAKDFFAFNMQFKFDQKYTQGDLEVVALGTESLMRNEIRSQRLLQIGQTVMSNPAVAPLFKWDEWLRELVVSVDLEEDKFVNDPRAAMLQAMLMRQYAETMGPAASGQSAQQAPGGAPNPNDPTGTGGGNIAPGASPEPGAQGFTGGGGATGAGAQANAQAAQQGVA